MKVHIDLTTEKGRDRLIYNTLGRLERYNSTLPLGKRFYLDDDVKFYCKDCLSTSDEVSFIFDTENDYMVDVYHGEKTFFSIGKHPSSGVLSSSSGWGHCIDD